MNGIYPIRPDEVYHLAAQSHVRMSFDIPEYTGDVTSLGRIRILEAIRQTGVKSKFISSEQLGDVWQSARCRSERPLYFIPAALMASPRSTVHWATVNYRESTISSPVAALCSTTKVRGAEMFVTRKIKRAVARIKAGRQKRRDLSWQFGCTSLEVGCAAREIRMKVLFRATARATGSSTQISQPSKIQ